MSRKKRSAPKGDVVWRQSVEEATLAGKPRYNGFACGHGAHGSAKYDRAKAKRRWQAQMRSEGASRGSFLFLARRGYSVDRCPVTPGRPRERSCLWTRKL